MNIGVIGAGYVGLATGVVLADLGHHVICADSDAAKIEALQAADCPVHEPGLSELLCHNFAPGRLSFTTDTCAAVRASDVIFIAVGTPLQGDRHADLTQVRAAAADIARALNGHKLIVNKSTGPVGTTDLLAGWIRSNAAPGAEFDVCCNPEFLREGSAVQDTLQPDRIVIGATSPTAAETLAGLYAPLQRPLIITDVRTAELIKYASNAFLATKLSFINAIADICALVGADVSAVAQGMGADPRIGREFLRAGLGYGGSCLPKDSQAFIASVAALGYDFGLLRAVQEINASRVPRLLDQMESVLGGLQGKTIGVLGLAFKPNTDDLRESKALELIRGLLERGAAVRAYDPVARASCARVLPQAEYAQDPYDLARGCSALAIATEWEEFRTLDLGKLRSLMAEPVIFDGRNVYDPDAVRSAGFRYHGIGRP